MKRLNAFLKASTIVCLLIFFALHLKAEEGYNDTIPSSRDSTEISLLTCSPGSQIWSLYGHTAIRIQQKGMTGDLSDIVVNYGIFNFRQKNFMLRFVFGRTDYQMGIVPFQVFMMEYAREGRQVIQQRLHLTSDEKNAILQALARNYQLENRTYRYNYFYDNCTTRARDILVDNLTGKVEYAINPNITISYREMIHQWNGNHRWARMGNDLLLGVQADAKTDYKQQQFLPDSLRHAFDKAMVVMPGGWRYPLVDSTAVILSANEANVEKGSQFWTVVSPSITFALLLLLTLLIALFEVRRRKVFWLYDVILLTLDGLGGLVLFAMVFSQHPTVRINFQLLLLNPLSIGFAYSVGNSIIKGRFSRYWTLLEICILLFAIGGIFQHYAEGMWILALVLLVRAEINRFVYTHKGIFSILKSLETKG